MAKLEPGARALVVKKTCRWYGATVVLIRYHGTYEGPVTNPDGDGRICRVRNAWYVEVEGNGYCFYASSRVLQPIDGDDDTETDNCYDKVSWNDLKEIYEPKELVRVENE